MASFEELLSKQEYAMHILQRSLPNFKKLGQAKWTPAVIKHRLESLEMNFSECKTLDYQLQIRATDTQRSSLNYFTSELFYRCEDIYHEAADFMAEALGTADITTNRSITEAKPQVRSSVNLPRLDLPSFDGRYTQWESFRDRFNSLIHLDESLTKVEKLHYLLSTLKGDALQTLSHLAITDSTYDTAWQILISRFENKRQLVTEHLLTLLNLPTLTTENAKSLRTLRDSSNAAIQALINLNRPVQSWPDLIVLLITRKLDRNTRRAWELRLGDSLEFPSYTELDKFLDSRIRALDAMQLSSTDFEPRQPSSASGSYRSKRVVSHHTSTQNSKPATSSRTQSSSSNKFQPRCLICKESHGLYHCPRFLTYSLDRRIQYVKEHKLCHNCLSSNHFADNCLSVHRCRCCSNKHHTLIHPVATGDKPSGASPDPSRTEPTISSNTLAPIASHFTSVLLATARVCVRSSNQRSIIVRALLDQGSAITIISEVAARKLKLARQRCSLRVAGINGAESSVRHSAAIEICAPHDPSSCFAVTAIILPSLTQYTPDRQQCVRKWPYLKHLRLADSDPFSQDPIDLVIGADLYGRLLQTGVLRGDENEPIAQPTVFGWILSGSVTSDHKTTVVPSCNTILLESLESQLRRFWELEDLPASSHLTSSEQQCEEHFQRTHRRDERGRYIVRLPFVTAADVTLGESRLNAVHSFLRLERRLAADTSNASKYQAFMAEYEQLGHMQRVLNEEVRPSNHYYIPHHGVIRESSTTTQLRVVFNASAKSSNGRSLNDFLSVGPRLQADLPAVLLRWRQFSFVFSADIEKMYRQILIDSSDADYQRILWRSAPSQPITDYRLTTVTYGTTSAPFLALRVLKQLVLDEGSELPLASEVLRTQTYVDDCLFGAYTMDAALRTREQLTLLLQKGGFRLRKWASNVSNLLLGIDAADHGLASERELLQDDSLHVLGIVWGPGRDTLRFRLNLIPEHGSTKREILSVIARLYDPLGWLAPVLIVAKILIQRLWERRCDWDCPLPLDILQEWNDFRADLPCVGDLEIPRWTGFHPQLKSWEIHGFSDASIRAFAAAVYIRCLNVDGRVSTTLLMSKSKVAPIKTISVPRLELCAAHLLAKLVNFVVSSLALHPCLIYCWTDSTIVLAWLRQSPSKWNTFVANRVSKIQTLTNTADWRHVPSQDNPADDASRGIRPREILHHSLWWRGPDWLTQDETKWPSIDIPTEGTIPEARTAPVLHAVSISVSWDLQSRFSSWSKLLRVTAYVFRFIHLLRKPPPRTNRRRGPHSASASCPLEPVELRAAETHWLKAIQYDLFSSEIEALKKQTALPTANPLSSLSPYLDSDGLLRVGGRLQFAPLSYTQQHPILLKTHQSVDLLIRHYHSITLHGGLQLTLTSLRRRFWVLRARPTVRSILHRCVQCARERAKCSNEFMGSLPSARVTRSTRAFEHTGVDYAGPISVRTAPGRGQRSHKAYIALFICLTVKATHLELVSDYSTATFVAAYHRFISRRGKPTVMYSDNGTTFQGAERELRSAHSQAVRNHDFQNQLAGEGVQWRFLPPSAPHFGGLWEAGVKSTKYHMRRVIGHHTLTFEETSTLLCRIEACLNSRPIAPVSDHLDDYQVLTPGHFLIGTPLLASPEPSLLELNEQRLSRWQLIGQMTETFWKSWASDYVQLLQQRPKWRTVSNLAKVGRIVLLRDSNAPPSLWSLGRIIACHPGDDGVTRVVTVKTSKSEYVRPIVKLSFLPVEINEESGLASVTTDSPLQPTGA